MLSGAPARAELGVFAGDPLDPATNAPYVLLPGLPLVYPGMDGVYGTDDDVVDTGFSGDVDLVVRTQGTVDAGPIPPPASGIDTAPLVVAGGEHGSAGTRLLFSVIVSDGVTPPAAGSALAAPELDAHGALVIAYPDLDGDGVIGPTGAAGAAVEVQRQETLQLAGRRPAIFFGGVAVGSLGTSLGAPASAGGLGLVLAAVGTTGVTPGLYFDGPWIATALPYMLPLDPSTYFDSDGESSADGVVEIELEREAILMPAPDDPVLGAAYALPLDGSSPTIDLARSVSGPVVGAVFARPVDPATFVADFARRLLPTVDGLGARMLVESVDALDLPNDGPGGTATLTVFLADLLGNATDPDAGGTPVVVEAGPSLRIVTPDTDGDPHRETLPFATAASATLAVDDAGGAGDGAADDRIVAHVGGVPVASVRVTLTGAMTPPAILTTARAQMARARKAGRDRVTLVGTFLGDAQAIDPATQVITVTLANAGGTVQTRIFAAGSLIANKQRTSFRFHDDQTTLVVKRPRRAPAKHTMRVVLTSLDLGGADLSATDVTATVSIGPVVYESTLACTVAKLARSSRCIK
jgi:hypothetical protein